MAVYETYYGCRQEPFSLSPDPGFLFAAAPHREALAQLRYLILERKGFAVITGEVGTGKTMLLRKVMEDVGPNVQTGYVFNPPRTRQALYDAIADELGLDLDGNPNPAMELNRHFLSTFEAGTTVVLIFDEAQALPIEVLEEIRLLTNIETPRATPTAGLSLLTWRAGALGRGWLHRGPDGGGRCQELAVHAHSVRCSPSLLRRNSASDQRHLRQRHALGIRHR